MPRKHRTKPRRKPQRSSAREVQERKQPRQHCRALSGLLGPGAGVNKVVGRIKISIGVINSVLNENLKLKIDTWI